MVPEYDRMRMLRCLGPAGQAAYFGASSSWSTTDGKMIFLTRAETEAFLRRCAAATCSTSRKKTIPAKTKLGEPKLGIFSTSSPGTAGMTGHFTRRRPPSATAVPI